MRVQASLRLVDRAAVGRPRCGWSTALRLTLGAVPGIIGPVAVTKRIGTVEELEDALSTPTAGLVAGMKDLAGDIIVLGAGGKMGPGLARMAKRAADAAGTKRRVVAVSRFSDPAARAGLETAGVEVIPCDLMAPGAVDALPDAPNVIYMAGTKFGTTGAEAATWAQNAYLPGLVCERYKASRIVAFSSGNVYPFSAPTSGGAVETDAASPRGEYAWSVLGRERVVQFFSARNGTPSLLLRLNYSCELRYGVIVDIARRIHEGKPVGVDMGFFNVIWQRDANAVALQSLSQARSPAAILNITGPETLSVRDVAAKLGTLMGRGVSFTGTEAPDALLNNSRRAFQLFGKPETGAEEIMQLVADWVARGGASIGKPTHFDARDGKF
jgi:nucleoside-diphosphate-sugar epimerase